MIETRVPVNRGNPDAPLGDDEIARKFKSNVSGLLSLEHTQALLALLSSFDTASGLSELMELLTFKVRDG